MSYTHADHDQACQTSAEQRIVHQAWVQVRASGAACCGCIQHAWRTDDGIEFWKIDVHQPLVFTGSYPAKAVRQCSGVDGRCVCAGETGQLVEVLQ